MRQWTQLELLKRIRVTFTKGESEDEENERDILTGLEVGPPALRVVDVVGDVVGNERRVAVPLEIVRARPALERLVLRRSYSSKLNDTPLRF